MKIKFGLIILILLLFAAPVVMSLTVPSMDVYGGLLWLGNGDSEGAASPLLRTLGASVSFFFTPRFFLAPELSFTGTQYQLTTATTPENERAVPTEVEYADSIWYLSTILDIHAGFSFNFSEALSGGVSLFPSFIFRIPMLSWGVCATDEGACRQAMTSYLYSKARFLYLGANLFFHWKLSENLGLSIRSKWYLPWFHMWDGETGIPFWDQMMSSLTIGLRIYFQQ